MQKNQNVTYPLPVKIIGVGRYLPGRIVSSSELEAKCGLPEGWCQRKQGVRERRWAEDETISFMGAEAAREAAADAGIKLTDIDLIITASHSFEKAIPEDGPLIQQHLGLAETGIPCLRVTAACVSFLAALDVSASLLTSGRYRNILIVTTEITTGKLDFSNPAVCTLMGDASAAVVVTRTPLGEAAGIHAVSMETYSEASDISSVSGGAGHSTLFRNDVLAEDFVFDYDPQSVRAAGIKYNQKFLARLWPPANKDSFRLIIPNQASRLTIDFMKLSFPADRIMNIIEQFGNCGAAGFPLALYEAVKKGRISRGDMVLLEGMTAGFTLMGMVLTY
ncbi:MAG: ketoacyl-ACP synthase III [Candidatus Aminicenantes bacterium]|nr:ketoacyl-ACP synthase III [Candidatus Aminicenantes bacterium]